MLCVWIGGFCWLMFNSARRPSVPPLAFRVVLGSFWDEAGDDALQERLMRVAARQPGGPCSVNMGESMMRGNPPYGCSRKRTVSLVDCQSFRGNGQGAGWGMPRK